MEPKLPSWMGDIQCRSIERPGSWTAFDCELRVSNNGSESFPYIALVGTSKEVDVDTIGSELFNHDLQKVDVTNVDDILSFCRSYGTPTSPVYDGEQRLKLFRARRELGTGFSPLNEHSLTVAHSNPQILHFLGAIESRLDPRDPSIEIDALLPALQSELARAQEARGGVVGAVSLLEAAQALRLLQTATVYPMAFRYAVSSGWTTAGLFEYLDNKQHVSQHGTRYFRYNQNDIFLGHPLANYQDMMGYEDFRRMVDATEVENPKPIYDEALASALYHNASRALAFLELAASSFAMPVIPPRQDTNVPSGSKSFDLFTRLRATRNMDAAVARLSSEGSISLAITYQFLSGFSLTDDEAPPYRRCENCGKIFRKYQDEGASKNIRNTRFCRKNCNFAFNKREARRKAKG